MHLTLGPVPYFWSADTIRAFYERVRSWPVDTVYVGELVCGKRRALTPDDWQAVAEDLAAAGKEVVLTTQALLEADSEVGVLERICANGRFPVEANDMGAVHLAGGPFVAGPHINTYNGATLSLLHERGAYRWVMPVELSQTELAALQAERPAGMETEIFAFGRLPLAFSARCFTARAHNLPKDQCGFLCGEDPDGKLLRTQDGENLFTINGIQIQSGAPANLVRYLADMRALGVDRVRISPIADDTETVAHTFRSVLDGEKDPAQAESELRHLGPGHWSNGFWTGTAGMAEGMGA